jgi:hypothetical protein
MDADSYFGCAMPDISLTDFVDFAISTPHTQLTKVRQICSRGSYDPRFDFWKTLREGVREFHEKGKKLDSVLVGLKDAKKLKRYPSSVKTYEKFASKQRDVSWFKPPSGIWSYGGLNVRVNPELGLEIAGKKYAIKLYFKDEKPTKQRLKVVFEMMRIVLLDATIASAVIDVSNGKIIVPKPMAEDLLPLLEAQALSFVHLWKAVAPKIPVIA